MRTSGSFGQSDEFGPGMNAECYDDDDVCITAVSTRHGDGDYLHSHWSRNGNGGIIIPSWELDLLILFHRWEMAAVNLLICAKRSSSRQSWQELLMQLAEIRTNPMMLVDCSVVVTEDVIPETETGTIISTDNCFVEQSPMRQFKLMSHDVVIINAANL